MSSHAALGVVKAGVATLKGESPRNGFSRSIADNSAGTGVRINCISPGQIDVGVSLQNVRIWFTANEKRQLMIITV